MTLLREGEHFREQSCHYKPLSHKNAAMKNVSMLLWMKLKCRLDRSSHNYLTIPGSVIILYLKGTK